MKKCLLILVTAICLGGALIAQCPAEPIVLTTQTQVNNFLINYPGCTETLDDLVIGPSPDEPITDLSPLSGLVFVKGDLIVQINSTLTSLTGLHNIAAIGGILDIVSNPGLTNLSGLQGLSMIGRSISVFDNQNLTSLAGLQNVSSIGAGLGLFANPLLNDISSLENTTFSGNLLLIIDNPALSVCANTGICNYLEILDPSTEVFIGFNAAGCSFTEQVQAACAALPVELLYFHAIPEERRVQLSWHIVSETDNDRFEVEHSPDGRQFKVIGMVKGRGTNTVPHTYTFTHHKPSPGINYYRLRQIDFDGDWEYSHIVSALFDPGQEDVRIFPNPVRDAVEVRGTGLEGAPYQLADPAGRIVQRGTLSEGRIDVSRLAAGLYVLLLQPDGAPVAKRLIKE
jgi:hypothetical protein